MFYIKEYLKFIVLDVCYVVITYIVLPLYNVNNKPMDQFHFSFFIFLFIDFIVVIVSLLFLIEFIRKNRKSFKKISIALILNIHVFYWLTYPLSSKIFK